MKRLVTIGVSAALVIAGFTFMEYQQPSCVTLYVDDANLTDLSPTTTCIPVDGTTNALDVLARAGLQIEGTQTYGNKIVCRVNGLPDPSVESCADMPPAEAYWAILVKERDLIPLPLNFGSAWGWAQTGVDEIQLDAGDSIGLVFANNGEIRFP